LASHGSSFQKVFLGAAGSSSASAGLDVDQVFANRFYRGTGSAQAITNDIDLSAEGGLVWIKQLEVNRHHQLFDTVRGVYKRLKTSAVDAEQSTNTTLTAFNDSSFTLGDRADVNASNEPYISWTFRKAPKFFDVLTYTGNSTNRTISHNLGSVPGMIIVKRTDAEDNWFVYHRGSGATKGFYLNATHAEITSAYWQNTDPTSTEFSIFDDDTVNANGGTYVAYLFAHNDGDGGFGPDGDKDIIKCGIFTGNGSNTGPVVDLGFEPQWLMIKSSTQSGSGSDWYIVDTMRGFEALPLHDNGSQYVKANSTDAETGDGQYQRAAINSTGFSSNGNNVGWNTNGQKYIYMAIRKGSLNVPTDATKVFYVKEGTADYTATFATDFLIMTTTAGAHKYIFTRMTDPDTELRGNAANGETDAGIGQNQFRDQTGVDLSHSNWYGSASNTVGWLWKRAPSFFDAVCYTGTGSARTISHNLGVIPEMMWVKCRSAATNWGVYYGDNTDYMILSADGAGQDSANFWNDTSPTASVFTLGSENDINKVDRNYIAYLFATAPGVSKVGSYTGNATDNHVIDCGFSSGARFVLIKKFSDAGEWFIFDTVRGIVSGADPFLELNQNRAEITNDDIVDPNSSGFALSSRADCNANNQTYIFYAIA